MFKDRFPAILGICLFLTILVYSLGLSGGFYFDDGHVLVDNVFVKIKNISFSTLSLAANSFNAGGRELSMLSFALNYYLFGDSAFWFKAVNLLIHCLNGFGIFILLSRLSSSRIVISRRQAQSTESSFIKPHLPLIIACLWLVLPINLTAVLYISQRMALLSSFFVIYGLIVYIWARFRYSEDSKRPVILVVVIGISTYLGYICKENAILLPAYIFLLEWLVFRFRNNKGVDKSIVSLFVIGSIALVILVSYQFATHPEWITRGYGYRYFSLTERVFTELRALSFYIFQTILPLNQHMGLWHDDFGLSTDLMTPNTTLYSLLFLLGLFCSAVLLRTRLPLLSLGILWFFVSHSIESTVFALELVHEHRNYLASAGVLLAIAGLSVLLPEDKERVIYLVSICLFVYFTTILFQRVIIWSDEINHAQHEQRNHPNSPMANFELGQKYYTAAFNGVAGAEKAALTYLHRAAEIDQRTIMPDLLLVLFSKHPNVDYDNSWIQSASEKLKKYPYIASSKGALNKFVQCLRAGKCDFPEKDMDLLFQAAEKTNDVSLLTASAFYYTDIKQDFAKASESFKRSARGRKSAGWVNYISFLRYVENTKEACDVLRTYQSRVENSLIDDSILYQEQLVELEKSLKSCS